MSKTYAYIRVSIDKQDLENQKFVVLQYANNKKLNNIDFIKEALSSCNLGLKNTIKHVNCCCQ